ncbi:MAG: hypothetical protein GVY29_07400, partial [Spirochaetes bacterium]|nr:hypothetical protein [Spirochaetota bacterium]
MTSTQAANHAHPLPRIALSAAVLLSVAVAAFGQEEARLDIVLLPLAVTEEESRLVAVAETIESTVSLAFRLLPGYAVTRSDPEGVMQGGVDRETLRRVAEENGAEVVIYGAATRRSNGELAVELNAYNYFDDVVEIQREETTRSVFEVFDMADSIALAFMEAFEEVPLAFGELRLDPSGADGSYTVFINGERIGDDLLRVDRLLTGRYRVRVEMERPGGTASLTEERIQIAEGEAARVSFDIPAITEEERRELASLRESAWERFTRGLSTGTESRLRSALELVRGLPESPTRGELLSELQSEQEEMGRRLEAAEITEERIAELRDIGTSEDMPPAAGAYVGRMADFVSAEAWMSHTSPYVPNGAIRVDGQGDDWTYLAPQGGTGTATGWGSPPIAISGVAAAKDDDYLYLVGFPEGALPLNLGYNFVVHDIQDRNGRDIGGTVIGTGVDPENNERYTYFLKDYWDAGGDRELSGGTIVVGSVVEARIPLSTITEPGPHVNMGVYRPQQDVHGGTRGFNVDLHDYTAVHPAAQAVEEARALAMEKHGTDGSEELAASGSEFFQGPEVDLKWNLDALAGVQFGNVGDRWYNAVVGVNRDLASWVGLGVSGGANVFVPGDDP